MPSPMSRIASAPQRLVRHAVSLLGIFRDAFRAAQPDVGPLIIYSQSIDLAPGATIGINVNVPADSECSAINLYAEDPGNVLTANPRVALRSVSLGDLVYYKTAGPPVRISTPGATDGPNPGGPQSFWGALRRIPTRQGDGWVVSVQSYEPNEIVRVVAVFEAYRYAQGTD